MHTELKMHAFQNKIPHPKRPLLDSTHHQSTNPPNQSNQKDRKSSQDTLPQTEPQTQTKPKLALNHQPPKKKSKHRKNPTLKNIP